MNPTTNTEAGAVADVAAKLTERQRRGLTNAINFGVGYWLWPNGTARGMIALGLGMRTVDGVALTDLAHDVRQHLEQGATAGVVGGKERGDG
ncbi:hypothetical protein [Sphingomonas faeni]|uniref:hypothetical protein n=1 Tax=Sphingomonas faeni TaxID=185950 RepID=UPI0033548704